ncbi:hypothetical protein [Okeania sp. KiyG1]|uniref:hypothetical protein n=1 Tax=Okeania sp. KiyG1 TaxID=2720165 RepID=UPI001922AFC1|nr:hypothetical protein [Okeania sp. KiyG1]GGA33764.1 hypothetical protein CYANOKiyG1_50880 [Okeania sp. KiyG1]
MSDMRFGSKIVKTISVASSTLSIYIATLAVAYAGPALSFRFDYLGLSQSQCLEKSANVLGQAQLPTPSNTINVNNTAFVSGENSEITAIIDCSEVSQSGRVTVMVSHPSSSTKALEWANYLLESLR